MILPDSKSLDSALFVLYFFTFLSHKVQMDS